MAEFPRDADGNVIITGFDVERILRAAGAPKAFAKSVAASCRASGLFDRCHADEYEEEIISVLKNTIELLMEDK